MGLLATFIPIGRRPKWKQCLNVPYHYHKGHVSILSERVESMREDWPAGSIGNLGIIPQEVIELIVRRDKC